MTDSSRTILGIDPGATTGWCLYNLAGRFVVSHGMFPGCEVSDELPRFVDRIVIEEIVPHGASYPQVVEAAWTGGEIRGFLRGQGMVVEKMPRMVVRKALQDAVHGTIRVVNDKTVWAALLALHGGDSAKKKGGSLYGVKAHERAALAVCVACGSVSGVS